MKPRDYATMTDEEFRLAVVDRLARIETRLDSIDGPGPGPGYVKTGGIVTAVVVLAEAVKALALS